MIQVSDSLPLITAAASRPASALAGAAAPAPQPLSRRDRCGQCRRASDPGLASRPLAWRRRVTVIMIIISDHGRGASAAGPPWHQCPGQPQARRSGHSEAQA